MSLPALPLVTTPLAPAPVGLAAVLPCPCCRGELQVECDRGQVKIWCDRGGECRSYRANDGAVGRNVPDAYRLLEAKVLAEMDEQDAKAAAEAAAEERLRETAWRRDMMAFPKGRW